MDSRRRAILEAAARRIAPHAFEDSVRGDRLVERVVRLVTRLPDRRRRDFARALTILGSRAAALTVWRPPRPFVRLGAESQDRLLERWTLSRIPALRSIVQSVRRLVLLCEYTSAEAQREIGYLGPYHSRNPAFPWEGALAGADSDAEPVARASDPTTAHHPPSALSGLVPLVLDGSTLRADVVVIGSGAGGAVAAARLAEAGHAVLIVEAGALLSGDSFDEQEGPLFRRLYAEEGHRTTDDTGISLIQGVGVGGGTTVNWMAMLRTPGWVLDEWANYHGTEGMRADDLAPQFERIEQETHTRPVPIDAHSPNNRIILDGARSLGWSAFPANINAKGCVRTGFCGYGCRTGAKQGGLQTFLPRAQAAGARLVTHARAVRIEMVERAGSFPRKRVTLRYAPPGAPPREVAIEAPVVVVAAGAIETPALLLRSDMGGSGTGCFLRLHPTSGLLGFYDHEVYGAGGIPLTAVCDEFLRLDPAGYGSWIECPPLHPGLGAAAAPGFGASHRDTMLRFPNIGSLIVLTRDGAQQGHSDGEVRVRRDGSLSIRYALNPADAAHMESGLVAAARLHFAAGASSVRSGHSRPITLHSAADAHLLRGRLMGPNDITLFSAHVNGTCRLGADRRTAGTDPHGECFGAPGVFVADGSLLPTALGVNPQETIMVLATIVAERIASRRRPG